MRKAPEQIQTLAAGVAEPMGYELVGVELVGGGGDTLLRVYIDRAGGISLEDCEKVSRQFSAVLDVEDPIAGEYRLEVSSPGLDRPLFELAHFARFEDEQVKLQLTHKLDGRRRLRGKIVGVEQQDVMLLLDDGEEARLPFDAIDSARLVPKF